MSTVDATTQHDARNIFLTREDLYTRHGWERKKGYLHIRELIDTDPTFPRPIGNRWRLDHIQAWEDWRALEGLRQAQATSEPAALPEPVKRRPGRPKREAA